MPRVYIGEAENCLERLKQHNREKDFWEAAVIFITNNNQNQFTKTDAKFLERLSFDKAQEANRYKLDQTVPASSFVPEWRKCDLIDIFETMKVLLSTLGYPVFNEVRKTKETDNVETVKETVFYCKRKEVEAKGEYSEEGFVVFEGSHMLESTSSSIHNYLITKREGLIQDEVVSFENGKYVFKKDYLFTLPSQAASIVLGRNANGWMEWKNIERKTLDTLKRKNLE
jgi:hypothetical protein